MNDFAVCDFCAKPSVEFLRGAKVSKDHWKFIAVDFKIPYNSSHTKAQLKSLVLETLIKQGILPESVLDFDASNDSDCDCISDLGATALEAAEGSVNVGEFLENCGETDVSEPVGNLSEDQVKFKKRELEEMSERRKWERESFDLVTKHKQESRDADLKREIKLKQEEARLAIERKREEMKIELEFEREKVKLQVQLLEARKKSEEIPNKVNTFDISKNSLLVSSFDEDDPESFFDSFEKLAKQLGWEERYWSVLVQTKFVGKARLIYNNLSSDDSKIYEVVKNTILLAYDQVQETYRQRFRSCQKSPDTTFIEFAEELSRLFEKWLKPSGARDYESLKNLMLLDQFKFRVPPDLRMYLEEREVTNFNQAAKLADTYFMTHRRSFAFRQNNVKGFSGSQYPAISGGGRSAAPGNYEPERLFGSDIKAIFCALL